MEIGDKIKKLRKKMDLTQEELAERSELTKGFISQLERNLNSPSVDTLADVLEALGTNLGDFFTNKEDEQIIFKEEDFFVGTNDKLGHKMEWIVPNSVKNNMEPVMFTLDRDGCSKVYTPNEGEEFGYVVKGEIKLVFGEKEYRLKKGETFYFFSDEERYIKNIYKGESKVLWISNPPNF
ncbi:helix-turn-helix domain-containing protein [Helcococcus bovis]|uniref:helix-turn-helix domain-containing protein n=1 Tax=Helcococcus bovis TaxID=3153252 RepID=UPI0038BD9086